MPSGYDLGASRVGQGWARPSVSLQNVCFRIFDAISKWRPRGFGAEITDRFFRVPGLDVGVDGVRGGGRRGEGGSGAVFGSIRLLELQ